MPSEEESVDARKIYRLGRVPLGEGTFSFVFPAEHRETGTKVALKRAKVSSEARNRIAQEIKAQKRLVHPNIMPIWDHDPGYKWYAMPIAKGTLDEKAAEINDEALYDLLLGIADALSLAHQKGFIHRDISPKNILLLPALESRQERWVVADWGMVRRPRADSSPALTRTGQQMGTPGFDAPEILEDARQVTAAVDVYSLGRVAAWHLTGKRPRTGVPLLPEGDKLHWRSFVKQCTEEDVTHRIGNMELFQSRLKKIYESQDEDSYITAQRALTELFKGQRHYLDDLLALAVAHPDDAALFIDYLAKVPTPIIKSWAPTAPVRASQLATKMARHLLNDSWEDRDRSYVSTPLSFIFTVLASHVSTGQLGEAQDVAAEYFAADVYWKHQRQRERTLDFLASLEDTEAAAIARVLAHRQEAIDYYKEASRRFQSAAISVLLAK